LIFVRPRQIAGFVAKRPAVRDVTSFGPPTVTQSAEMSEEEREKQAIFNDMNMNDEWEMMNMNVQRAQGRSRHKTHSRPVVVVVAVGNVSAAAGERDEQLVHVLLPLSCLLYKNWRHLPSNQFLSLNFLFECKKKDLCGVLKKFEFGALSGGQSEFNFKKKIFKILEMSTGTFPKGIFPGNLPPSL
jgi:hypothetical protein